MLQPDHFCHIEQKANIHLFNTKDTMYEFHVEWIFVEELDVDDWKTSRERGGDTVANMWNKETRTKSNKTWYQGGVP